MKLNLTQAAKLFGVTKQAIYVAIRKGFIPSTKDGADKRHRYVERSDVAKYRLHRWKRTNSYNNEHISPHMAAELLGIPVQRIYHLLRTNKLPYWRQGKAIFTILKDDLMKIKDVEVSRQKRKISKKLREETLRRESTRRIVRKTNKPN